MGYLGSRNMGDRSRILSDCTSNDWSVLAATACFAAATLKAAEPIRLFRTPGAAVFNETSQNAGPLVRVRHSLGRK
jgi:hypothetical protein